MGGGGGGGGVSLGEWEHNNIVVALAVNANTLRLSVCSSREMLLAVFI